MKLALIIAVIVLGASIYGCAHAGTIERASPTLEQIAACKDDAIRFCWSEITEPGGESVRTCMFSHRRQLSQRCREAFAK
jgi:sialic acid synthase SpsE